MVKSKNIIANNVNNKKAIANYTCMNNALVHFSEKKKLKVQNILIS